LSHVFCDHANITDKLTLYAVCCMLHVHVKKWATIHLVSKRGDTMHHAPCRAKSQCDHRESGIAVAMCHHLPHFNNVRNKCNTTWIYFFWHEMNKRLWHGNKSFNKHVDWWIIRKRDERYYKIWYAQGTKTFSLAWQLKQIYIAIE
jgi:hypothetical protein